MKDMFASTMLVVCLAVLGLSLLIPAPKVAPKSPPGGEFITEAAHMRTALEGWDGYPLAFRRSSYFASPVRLRVECWHPIAGTEGFFDQRLDGVPGQSCSLRGGHMVILIEETDGTREQERRREGK